MDILAARKKAAEKARSQQKPEPTQVLPAESQPPASVAIPQKDTAEAPGIGDGQATQLPAAGAFPEGAPGRPAETEPLAATMQEIELLSFRLGGEEYAVMVSDVREVLKTRDLTMVPNAPAYVLGVTSLRGAMLPVIDLCKRLGLTPGVRDEKSRIIVVNPDEEDAGLMVDRVTGVFRIMPDAIRPTPENVEHGGEFLRGIVRKDDKLYIMLDPVKAVGS